MSEFSTPLPPASIGERIRQARKEAGLNQSALAERVGVTQPAVANWESGVHDPRRLMLAKLAEALAVPMDWLAEGARSALERDKHPAAAYLRRPIQHTPVISFRDAVRFIEDPTTDPHSFAEDYIPVTTGAHRVFGIFVSDGAIDLAFPKDSLIVIDYADRRPTDGTFCLAAPFGFPMVRRWRSDPARLEPYSSDPSHKIVRVEKDPRIIGCARVSIRFH